MKIPDDARALRKEARAVRRELHGTPRGRRPAYAVLGTLAAISVLVVVTRPTGGQRPRPVPDPLASPLVTAGTVGGLLPDVTLQGRTRATSARDLRPAVLMLVAPNCDCVDALRHVVSAAAPLRLVTYVVESGPSLRQAESLAARAGGDVGPYHDPGGALAAAYRLRTDAALVLVRADGVVTRVIDAVGPTLRLDAALRELV